MKKAKYTKEDLDTKVAEAKKLEDKDEHFSAAIFYKEALSIANQLQDSKSIKLYKTKLVEMNKKSISSGKDFQSIEIPFELPEDGEEKLKRIIAKIVEKDDLSEILNMIGSRPDLTPKLTDIEKSAKGNMPLSHLLATLNTISEKGHNVQGGSDGEYSWFMQLYDINQKFISVYYLNNLMYMLIKDDKLNLIDLKDYFSNSNLIPKENLEVILIGLDRYFTEDYVSCLHILVPQFEALILSIAQKCGINTITLNSKEISTRTSTLSMYHFESEEFQKIFGEDFCRQLKFVLFEELGYRLRHKIAHGEISLSECNFSNATLILYFYLVLLARITVK